MDYRWAKERLQYFKSELGRDPEYEFQHREHDWRYITFNPWQPAGVRGLWCVNDDVHWLHMWLASHDQCGRDGLYARWQPGDPPFLELYAISDDETVDRASYEYYMGRLQELIVADPESFCPCLGADFNRIGIARRTRV